jgi:hypothetical protein
MRFATVMIPLAILVAPVGRATADPLPDPATISVPDVTPSADPRVQEEGYKFYYFHNTGVSFAEAHQDFTECRAHLAAGGGVRIPGFIAWDEAHRRQVVETTTLFPGGMAGDMLAFLILPKIERGLKSNKMRRCMGTRGYVRFAIPEAIWDTINKGDETAQVNMQAKLAVGPKPNELEVSE